MARPNELTLLIRGTLLLHHPFNDKIKNAINITVIDKKNTAQRNSTEPSCKLDHTRKNRENIFMDFASNSVLQQGDKESMKGEPVMVMLVEDNLDHAELVMRTLQDHRIANRVRHFTDGQTALDYLFRRGEFSDPAASPRPHVILLDLRLPRVDGLEVLEIVKKSDELKAIPIVILTTSEAEKDVVQAYNQYANSYLVKPLGYEEFKELMDDLGFYWLGWNMHPNI